MNKSQRIYLETTGNTASDKYIRVQLEQEIDSIEFLSMSIYTKDAYMDFNADYGVLVGRVIANGGIGIPNAKISIFIPLSDEDAENGNIKSIYPYKTPRDKNAQGKRYNLLPRVSSLEQSTGLYKPKQPFGSFPIKPEIVTNPYFLDVYKKYYKYTALTNEFGDYMIFGVPIGLQTVHMSVDITDIGKYSMSPASMIKAGYPANLFLDNGKEIKPSDDLSDLPNIETQEISVDVIPFWGDATNFIIGITRQDFRIRAVLESSFTIFGTSMTMGQYATWGDPDRNKWDKGYYYLSDNWRSNSDIRTYRPAPLDIKIFTYNTTLDYETQIKPGKVGDITAIGTVIELSSSEYYLINEGGDFLLNVPCNRRKVITDGLGNEVVVPDDSPNGIFTRFYGMMLVEYTNLPINKSFSDRYDGNNQPFVSRGRFKIPQNYGFAIDNSNSNLTTNHIDYRTANDNWRKEYQEFSGGTIYSIAQFLPTKSTGKSNDENFRKDDPATFQNHENYFYAEGGWQFSGGLLFKVAGADEVSDDNVDTLNYVVTPTTASSQFRYDFPANVIQGSGTEGDNKRAYLFGGQWLNLCLVFPQFVRSYGHTNDRYSNYGDVYLNNYQDDNWGMITNTYPIFAGLTNTGLYMKGDAFRTKFIAIPKETLSNLYKIDYKGLNIRLWNDGEMPDVTGNTTSSIKISTDGFEYQMPTRNATKGRDYTINAWDSYYDSYNPGTQIGDKPTAYLFKGMYDNDCVKLLFDQNIL